MCLPAYVHACMQFFEHVQALSEAASLADGLQQDGTKTVTHAFETIGAWK